MTWPIQNVINISRLERQARVVSAAASKDKDTNEKKKKVSSKTKETSHWAAELIVRHFRLSTYFIVAYFSYQYTFPMKEAAKNFALDKPTVSWMLKILLRNLLLEIVLIGGWHWYLYERKTKQSKVLASIKFNKKNQYERPENLRREKLFTTLGFLMSTLYEIVVIRLWSTNNSWIKPYYTDFFQYPMWSIFHLLIIGYWRDLHFYFCHRFMHPWRFKLFGIVDIGQWMYTHVHSLHHKSHNPGPWSGLSMHPIEHLLYYTCTLLNFFFVLHPIHFLFNKFHADLSPIAGHDGHDQPAGGSLFHYLHHAHFECNYGTPMVPLDVWFGTYVSTEKEWQSKKRK